MVLARRLLLILAFALPISVNAVTMVWHKGVIVLQSKDVLVGEVSLQPALKLIFFRTADGSSYYHLKDVNYVTYNDTDVKMSRKFLSLESTDKGLPERGLFEVIVSGKLSVVRKPETPYIPAIDDVRAYDYYVVEDNRLVELSDFKRKILPLIAASCSRECLKEFMHEKQIDPSRNEDAMRLIEYYNDGSIARASMKVNGDNLY